MLLEYEEYAKWSRTPKMLSYSGSVSIWKADDGYRIMEGG